jgi:hypothetical protein
MASSMDRSAATIRFGTKEAQNEQRENDGQCVVKALFRAYLGLHGTPIARTTNPMAIPFGLPNKKSQMLLGSRDELDANYQGDQALRGV